MDHLFESLCEALCVLVEPPNKESNLKGALEANIKNVCEKISVKNLSLLPTLKSLGVKVYDNSDIRWKWVSLALHIFLSMKACKVRKDILLSVRQEKAIRTCLEFVVSLALLPGLLPGVGIPIAKRCSSETADWVLHGDSDELNNRISIIEIHERLSAVTKILVLCIETDCFRGPILSRHLSDLLAALCQLSMAPLKKPQTDVVGGKIKDGIPTEEHSFTCSNGGVEQDKGGDECTRIFVKERQEIKRPVLVTEVDEGKKPCDLFAKKNEFKMTPELWNSLQIERQYFSKILDKLVKDTYQPLVIRDLLLLQGSPDKSGEKGKPAPVWLRRGCANLLNSRLFCKGGVVATVHAICDVFSVPQSKCDTWAQHAILGKLIVMAVSAKKGDASCCQVICSQVMELLSTKNIKDSKDYARAGVTCVSMLLDVEEEVCRTYILDPLLLPLIQTSVNVITDFKERSCGMSKDSVSGSCKWEDAEGSIDVECDEEKEKNSVDKKNACHEQGKTKDLVPVYDFDSSLDVLHFCFVENEPGISLPAKFLAPTFHTLLKKYHDPSMESNKRSIISSLLLKFLSGCSDELLLSNALDSVLFEGSSNLEELKNMAEQSLSLESQDETQDLEANDEKLLKELMESHLKGDKLVRPVEELGKCDELGWGSAPLLKLVSSNGGSKAAEVLFHYVLQTLPKGGENSNEKSVDLLISIAKLSVATQLLCHLLEVPTVSELIKKNPKDVVSFLGHFLAKEAEKAFGKHVSGKVLCETSKVHDFVAAATGNKIQNDNSLLYVSEESFFPSILDLNLGQNESKASEEVESEVSAEKNHSEFVLVALLILKSLCEAQSHKSEKDWWSPLREILPQIRAYRRESSCPEVRAMAEDVACAILTRGKAVPRNNAESMKNKQGTSIHTKTSEKNPSKEEYKNRLFGREIKGIDLRNTDSEESLNDFENALKMAQENAVHLRGHALISLSKLVSSKDPITLRHQTTLLQIFQDNLKHDDSYIYLAAINGLEKLGYIFPYEVLESLADEFAEIGVVRAGNSTFNDIRLKVGEALLRVTRTLGEMAPKYSCLLLNAFLGGVRDGDGLVRASSLSNLGEVCKILSFRLGPIMTEVLWCVRCVLETDSAVEARRAAVLVVTLLLQGMGVTVFKALEAILPELYRTLKSVRSNDPDEVVQVHAQLALEEVDSITMQFLFPKQTFQKKIFVLDPPS